MRDFFRYHFFKILLGIIAIQFVIFYWLEKRNHWPEAVADEVSVFEGQSVQFKPISNDTDKDEDELILHEVSSPQQGTLIQEENILTYSAKVGFAGTDSFLYTVSDGKKLSKETYIKVRVNENQKPTVNTDYVQLYAGNKVSIAALGNDIDNERDSIFIKEFTEPLHGQIEKQGNIFVYTPTSKIAVTDSFQYTASDGISESDKVTVKIDVKDKNDVNYPWLHSDVGNPSLTGGMKRSGGSYIVKASGNDIWNNADNFHFVYQAVKGDCEIIAKVTSLEDTNPWAKAGVMFRETLAANSKNAYMLISSQNGESAQVRQETGGSTQGSDHQPDVKAPFWVKAIRKGNTFTGYRSPDGKNWIEVGSAPASMSEEVYVGLAVTSHDDEKLCTASFQHVTIKH